MPNVIGVSGMDAVSLLENLGLSVQFFKTGVGAVKSQSIDAGEKIRKGETVKLELT